MSVVGFFFFKQKTAYEMLRSLVGSEMCIRDRLGRPAEALAAYRRALLNEPDDLSTILMTAHCCLCLLYTSDAADDLLCVDLGGRRSI